MFKFNKEHIEKPKHEHEIINFLIFDDIIGTNNGAFRKSGSALQNLIIKNRHHFTNVILTTQYIKSINPIIRENIDIWCLYKSQNKKSLIDKIYELVSGVVSEEHFIELFEYATDKPYSAFVIDNHKETPKENKFKIKSSIAVLSSKELSFFQRNSFASSPRIEPMSTHKNSV